MEVEVHFYAQLRRIAGTKARAFTLPQESSVRSLLDAVLAAFPDLRRELVDEQGSLHEHVRIILNGHDLAQMPDGLAHRLSGDEQVSIFPAIGGG